MCDVRRRSGLRVCRSRSELGRAVSGFGRGEGDGRALREFTEARVGAAARVFRARAEYHGVTPRIDIEVLARAWVGEQITVMRWWLEDEPPKLSPEEVTGMLRDLSLRGRYWANGFDGEPHEDAD